MGLCSLPSAELVTPYAGHQLTALLTLLATVDEVIFVSGSAAEADVDNLDNMPPDLQANLNCCYFRLQLAFAVQRS